MNAPAGACQCAQCKHYYATCFGPERWQAARRLAKAAILLALMTLVTASAIVAFIALTGCGGNARMNTIKTSVTAVDAARDGFLEYVRQHQLKLVADANPAEEGARAKLDAKLGAFRDKRDKVVEAFGIAYRALALAATKQDETSLNEALAALKDLLARIVNLKNGVDP